MFGDKNRFLASPLASALNRHLSGEHRLALSRYAGRTLGLRYRRFRMNWQIGQDGGFFAVSSLLDADALITAAGGEIQLRGDAKFLRLLSGIADETDFPVVLSGAFGPLLAPRVLYFIERGRAAFADAVRRCTADAAEVADYGGRVVRFCRDVERLSLRVGTLCEGR